MLSISSMKANHLWFRNGICSPIQPSHSLSSSVAEQWKFPSRWFAMICYCLIHNLLSVVAGFPRTTADWLIALIPGVLLPVIDCFLFSGLLLCIYYFHSSRPPGVTTMMWLGKVVLWLWCIHLLVLLAVALWLWCIHLVISKPQVGH